MRRRYLMVLAILCLPLFARGAAPAQAADDPTTQGLLLIHAAYDDLLALFYRPLDPTALLQSAWQALGTAKLPGMPAPPALGPLPQDQDGAFAAFDARFRLWTKSRYGKEPEQAAFAATNAMVKGINEQHTHFLMASDLSGLESRLIGDARPPSVAGQGAAPNAPRAPTPLSSRMLEHGIGYIRLEEFVLSEAVQGNGLRLLTDFDRRLDDLEVHGATSLILDLRDNPGGSVTTADALLGRFLPDDAITAIRFDERGHRVTGIVGGDMRRTQLPLVVLVNGNSASAAESTASTLRESNRAILVGERTHGALATSGILPLPLGTGLQIAFAEQISGRDGVKIDETGVPVDVEVANPSGTIASASGTDPQLQAAIAAVAQAPQPPAPGAAPATTVTQQQVHAVLAGYAPDVRQVQLSDGPVSFGRAYYEEVVHPNQLFDVGARDPLALQQLERDRGWLGRHTQLYGADLEEGLGVELSIDVYATPEGAADALATNDFPDTRTQVDSPVQLGDGTAAYRGEWMNLGDSTIVWRRGNALMSVTYSATPGNGRFDLPAAFAQSVDQVFDRYPLRADALTPAAAAAATVEPSTAPQPTSKHSSNQVADAQDAGSSTRQSTGPVGSGQVAVSALLLGVFATSMVIVIRGLRRRPA